MKFKHIIDKLSPIEKQVVCNNGTEPPFKNAFYNNKREGLYLDIVSGAPLFLSTDKFDSGTGWPSFTRPIEGESILEKKDTTYGMVRTEVRGKTADTHLGHLFEDGPEPTGLRYCINSASLRFIDYNDLEKCGYAGYKHLIKPEDNKTKRAAVFAGGCFWCMEGPFESEPGVFSAEAGYTGGTTLNPDYESVCTGRTGHAEAVLVWYDSSVVSYERLLKIFWRQIDPTDGGGQFADRGSQYRTAIFTFGEEQRLVALKSKEDLQKSKKFSSPVVTEISPASVWYPAEEEHQDYYKKRVDHYNRYKKGSGRADFQIKVWGE